MISRIFVLVALVAVFSSACAKDGPVSNPVGPLPTSGPSAATLRVVAGLGGTGIAGTVVKSEGLTSAISDNEGKVQFVGLTVGKTLEVSNAPQYRSRRTLYCGASDILLWPDGSDGVDEALTKAVGYSFPQGASSGDVIWRTDKVGWIPSSDFNTDGKDSATITLINAAKANLEKAAAAITTKSRGAVVVKVGVPGTWTYPVRINPNALDSGNTAAGLGGFIEFKKMEYAGSYTLVLHEGWRSTGVTGSSPYPGILNRFPTGEELTPSEEAVMLLRLLTRPLFAQFAGDDDTMIPCSAR